MWKKFIQRASLGARCRLCRAKPLPGHSLCQACLDALPRLHTACPRCALPLAGEIPADGLCGECLRDPPAFDSAHVALRYRAPVDQLVSRFKYHHALSDGRLLAGLLADRLTQRRQQASPLPQLIVPLPLQARRLRERGFNQAAELARVLSRQSGIPWRSDLLLRHGSEQHQREADRKQRQRNVRHAFACTQQLPAGTRVALVDDVITTGATARAAARCLKQAGADWVEVWAVARTPRPGDR